MIKMPQKFWVRVALAIVETQEKRIFLNPPEMVELRPTLKRLVEIELSKDPKLLRLCRSLHKKQYDEHALYEIADLQLERMREKAGLIPKPVQDIPKPDDPYLGKRATVSNEPSLMIRGFPRSMTSRVYDILETSFHGQLSYLDQGLSSNASLKIQGELLNRTNFFKQAGLQNGLKQGALHDEEAYEACKSILDLHSKGYLIKDVTQPWIVDRYLKEHPGSYKTLFIKRNLTDVMYRMAYHGWWYPMRAACPIQARDSPCLASCHNCQIHAGNRLRVLAQGLLYWERTFYHPESKHGFVAHFDRLIHEPNYLFECVEALGYHPRRHKWMKGGFKAHRERVLAYRTQPMWKEMDSILEQERKA